jgi:hypothetical protein
VREPVRVPAPVWVLVWEREPVRVLVWEREPVRVPALPLQRTRRTWMQQI